MRLREFWNRSRIENPEGMPVGAIEISEATRETVVVGGVEITRVKLNQGGYFAGPDAIEQPRAGVFPSSESLSAPCPHCQGRGRLPQGWVEANTDGKGSAA
jgi:hypothetical protein